MSLDDRSPKSGEQHPEKKSGERVRIRITVVAVKDVNGLVTHFMQTAQYSSENKAAEEDLRENGKKYRNVLNSMQEGYFEVDLAGRLCFYNDSVKQFLGRSEHELENLTFRDFMTAEEAERVYRIFNRVYRTGQPSDLFDYSILRKDGRQFTLEDTISFGYRCHRAGGSGKESGSRSKGPGRDHPGL